MRRPATGRRKVSGLVVAVAVVAGLVCCGGLTALGALVSPDDKPAAPRPALSPVSAPTAEPATTEQAVDGGAPNGPATTGPAPTTAAAASTTKPATGPTKGGTGTKKPTKPPAVYYANCDAVRAAGAAPLYRGQPGYRAGLDRDGDGVACEK